jgi:26S proteasome regulatory subunit N1
MVIPAFDSCIHFSCFRLYISWGKQGQQRSQQGCALKNNPGLLGMGGRAELAIEKYIPLAPVMEGFIILQKKTEQ